MKYCLAFLLLIAAAPAHAQSTDAALNSRLSRYLRVTETSQWDSVLAYMYPRVFEIAPKEVFLKALAGMTSGDAVKVSIDSVQINRVDAITLFAKGAFTRMQYTTLMTMRPDPGLMETPASIANRLVRGFGEENVRLDTAAGIIKLKMKGTGYAIRDTYTQGRWAFVRETNGLEQIMPQALREKYLKE